MNINHGRYGSNLTRDPPEEKFILMEWEGVNCWNTVFVKSGLLGENSFYLPHV
jgi:hypothetical protein